MFETAEQDRDHNFDDEAYDDVDLETEAAESIDPLDAQSLGHHERDYDLGHEEIHLNLDAGDAPAEQTAEVHPPARETPHTN
jgi:ribosomal protein L11 methylase PrmA